MTDSPTPTTGLTVRALRECLSGDPLAMILGPAVQAGLSLALRLQTEHPQFWEQMRTELRAATANIDGLDASETQVMEDLIAEHARLVAEAKANKGAE